MAAFAAIAGGLCLAVCQWLIYCYAPTEAVMGIAQKIFYLHLPCALWALTSFLLVFIASIAFLIRRHDFWDHAARASAETGLLFCGLSLATGMVWGKVSWGVWWTWDPRLTTTLVMWFIYMAYLLIRQLEMPIERRRVIAAVIGIVAFLDVPLVFLSARIFRSIHPAVFGSAGGGLENEMLYTLLACWGAMGLFWLGLLMLRQRQLALDASLRKARRAYLSTLRTPTSRK